MATKLSKHMIKFHSNLIIYIVNIDRGYITIKNKPNYYYS